jgi:hypothetical protein
MPAWRAAIGLHFGSDWNLRCSLGRRSALRLIEMTSLVDSLGQGDGQCGMMSEDEFWMGTNIHTKVRSAAVFSHGENTLHSVDCGMRNALSFF